MANTEVLQVIHQQITYQTDTTALDKASAAIHEQLAELEKLNKTILKLNDAIKTTSATEVKKFEELKAQLVSTQKELDKTAAKTKGIFSEIGKGALDGLGLSGGVAGATAQAVGMLKDLAVASVKAAAKMEDLKLKFTTLLGSATEADALLNSLQNFASSSPFNLDELTAASEQLLKVGLSGNDLLPILSQIGDVAAGVGTDQLPVITAAFAQIIQDGALTKDTFQTLSDSGVNLLQLMADQTGASMATLQANLANGAIGFDQVQQAMAVATSEGGKFFDKMDEGNNTLNGSLGNLGDEFLEFQTILGELLSGPLKPIIDFLTQLLDGINEKLPEMMATFSEGEGLQTMIEGVQELFDVLYQALVPIIEALLPILDTFFAYTGNIYSAIAPLIQQIAEALVPVLNTLIAVLRPIISFIADVAVGAFKLITDGVGLLIENIKAALDFISDLGKAIGNLLGIDATISISTKSKNDLPDITKDVSKTNAATATTAPAVQDSNAPSSIKTNKPVGNRPTRRKTADDAARRQQQLQKETDDLLEDVKKQNLKIEEAELEHRKRMLKIQQDAGKDIYNEQLAIANDEEKLLQKQEEYRYQEALKKAQKQLADAQRLETAGKVDAKVVQQAKDIVTKITKEHENNKAKIIADGQKKVRGLTDEHNKLMLQKVKDANKQELDVLHARQVNESLALNDKYLKGNISLEDYYSQRSRQQLKHRKEENELLQEFAQKDVDSATQDYNNANGSDKDAAGKRLLEAQQELNRLQEEGIAITAELDELNKERKRKAIEAVQNLAQATVDAYSIIAQAQQEALDREIAYREKKVEAARRLAERGNTEVLRMEEKRLEEAQKKKEEIARRENIVNSVLAVSNSLVAVTGAIATATKSGDPYSIAVRVAAAIAAVLGALATGYSFVKSFDSGTEAFADGVVNYRGKGGPRDDANWVRISNGESVITADGTKRNRALLEAINNGTSFSLLNSSLPFTSPLFNTPQGLGSANGASVTNMKNVERKLDGVVAAIEDNKMKQNIFFNEYGVGIMTEKAIRKNNRRFK